VINPKISMGVRGLGALGSVILLVSLPWIGSEYGIRGVNAFIAVVWIIILGISSYFLVRCIIAIVRAWKGK
jgi:uncharacterized Tic20 family protein